MNILVIGRHIEIMETILRLLNAQPDWNAAGAITDDEATEKFNTQPFDIVLIGGGVEESSEEKFKTEFKIINPLVKIIRHYGGGSGLLFNEINEAMN